MEKKDQEEEEEDEIEEERSARDELINFNLNFAP